MFKKSDHSQQPEVDTQPSRVKKKQQKHLAIAVIAVALIGWVFYSFLSSHADSQSQGKRESTTQFQIDNPTTHVDGAGLWMERTRTELNKTQKTTSELQQQLHLIAQQKTAQEQANQSQREAMQTLQIQLKALQEKLNTANPDVINPQNTSANGVNTNIPVTAPSPPALHPLAGVSDDVLELTPPKPQPVVPPVIQPSKTPDTFVPAGTFVRAVMLGGADASTGVNSQSNPTPVLFRLLDVGTLPNHQQSHLKDCVATAAVIGDISSERGQMRLERLSCVSPNHREVIELPVEGTVFGPEGKNGVRGVPLWREGALLKRAFIAGSLSGFSQGIASQYTTTALSPTGTVSAVNNADIFKFGAAQGVSNAMDKIADYNIRRADQYHPVIQLSAGTIVDVVFLKGFYLDGQKHDNEKEAILPPFESTPLPQSVTAAQIPVAPNANSLPTATAINPLPLTPAQIRALQTNQPNSSFFKS